MILGKGLLFLLVLQKFALDQKFHSIDFMGDDDIQLAFRLDDEYKRNVASKVVYEIPLKEVIEERPVEILTKPPNSKVYSLKNLSWKKEILEQEGEITIGNGDISIYLRIEFDETEIFIDQRDLSLGVPFEIVGDENSYRALLYREKNKVVINILNGPYARKKISFYEKGPLGP